MSPMNHPKLTNQVPYTEVSRHRMVDGQTHQQGKAPLKQPQKRHRKRPGWSLEERYGQGWLVTTGARR
jgi:hypothetical protein